MVIRWTDKGDGRILRGEGDKGTKEIKEGKK
jgi:hypothetical protein